MMLSKSTRTVVRAVTTKTRFYATQSTKSTNGSNRVYTITAVATATAMALAGVSLYNTEQTVQLEEKKTNSGEHVKPKKVKPAPAWEQIANDPSQTLAPTCPGVYAWGFNGDNVVSLPHDPVVELQKAQCEDLTTVRKPVRIPYFDNMLLTDLALSKSVGLAVTESGDVLEWGRGYTNETENPITSPEYVLKGKRIQQVRYSNGQVYALGKNGVIYTFAADKKSQTTDVPGMAKPQEPRFGYFPWLFKKSAPIYYEILKAQNANKQDPLTQIQAGKEHLLALGKSGAVYSTATGNVSQADTPRAPEKIITQQSQPTTYGNLHKSYGQFGLANYSQFDDLPPVNVLHRITTLRDRKIVQIAAGDYHSIVRDNEGIAWGFGSNLFGQLGFPYSYERECLALPTQLPVDKLFGRLSVPLVSFIAAGGNNTYFAVREYPVREYLGAPANFHTDILSHENSGEVNAVNDNIPADTIYALGNGLYGQLAINNFIHVSSSPRKIKALTGLTEYSDSLSRLVKVPVSYFSVGATHAAVVLANQPQGPKEGPESQVANRDVLVWGHNEFGQIGTGKKNNIPLPTRLDAFIKPDDVVTTTEVATTTPVTAASLTAKPSVVIKGVDVSDTFATDMDFAMMPKLSLQLIKNQTLCFIDKISGKKRKDVKVEQVIIAGEYTTAVYYKKV
ncbi:RCC1/BLIP-II protein [Nadsonia fulvescens var. elongata DSM 6958]|uniref:RCC1/BLIP-II protein n=1 Tax=Nadsonia fulvescens var. elongata DSM 6958 TaxID=857566 RepID=A0A1E3PNJ4_9ASCO|nr:RCC1/BLIP-II protein [Nadsonia fulvescens var. elongata DSM 6958]